MSLFEIKSEHFDGAVKVIRSLNFPDGRGSLTVTYLENEAKSLGLPTHFVRQMYTRSQRGVLRGLHFQFVPAMGKLIQVVHGSAFLVAVDLRAGSPTFLKYQAVEASDDNRLQVWAPSGFARGYYTFVDDTVVQYNCDAYVGVDRAVRWNDPEIGIDWPFEGTPVLSARDAIAPTIQQLKTEF